MNKTNKKLIKITLCLALFVSCDVEKEPPVFTQDMMDTFSRGALMTTRIPSFEALKEIVDIEYHHGDHASVHITHQSGDMEVVSILEAGLNQNDYIKAKMGSPWDKFMLGLKSPFGIANRDDLLKAYMLARRKYEVYGEGDVALFDLAEQMVRHIDADDKRRSSDRDMGEKGYLNTFNHFIAQSFYTAIFSEELADFIADNHERNRLPELITGDFTEAQITDIENGAVDNYVDLVNNEWGQEYGKILKLKYGINKSTDWTPALMADYMNDVQDYFSSVFEIGFRPFRPTDEVLIRFARRTNLIMYDASMFLENIWFLRRPDDV